MGSKLSKQKKVDWYGSLHPIVFLMNMACVEGKLKFPGKKMGGPIAFYCSHNTPKEDFKKLLKIIFEICPMKGATRHMSYL